MVAIIAMCAACKGAATLTQALPHRQVGVDHVLLSQKKNVAHINVVCWHIHTVQLHCLGVLMLSNETPNSTPSHSN
jgi:hypothetical protein